VKKLSIAAVMDYFRTPRGRGVESVLVGAATAIIGIALVPPQHFVLGPAGVTTRAAFGNGDTVVRLPPFGSIVASTHAAPLRFELAVSDVEVERLASLATSATGREVIREEVESGLRKMALNSVLRLTIGGIVAGVLVAAFLFHRHIEHVIGAAAGAAVVLVILFGVAGLTYRTEAFEEPKFTGSLTKARQVINALTSGSEILDETRSRFEIATRRVSDLLVLLADPDRDPLDQSTVLLHVSDIHANPIGLEITEELAAEFDADAIVDTGDLASSFLDTGAISSFARPLDEAMAREIEQMEIPYLFVAGNHDSPALLSRLAQVENVVPLDGTATQIGSVRIMGWYDPTYSVQPIPEEEKAQQRLDEAADVFRTLARLAPDILAVHDQRLADVSLGNVPIVLAGHTHERDVDEVEGTIVFTLGSTGATGLKSFTLETDRDYEAELLYFDGDDLIAVDHISLTGVGGEFELERSAYDLEEQAGATSSTGGRDGPVATEL
jgi:Icc-related predicted phosphoesterase